MDHQARLRCRAGWQSHPGRVPGIRGPLNPVFRQGRSSTNEPKTAGAEAPTLLGGRSAAAKPFLADLEHRREAGAQQAA